MPLPLTPGFEPIYTSPDLETKQDQYIVMPSAALPRPIDVKIEADKLISCEELSDVPGSDSDESKSMTESRSDRDDPKICDIAVNSKKHNTRVGKKPAEDNKASEAKPEVEAETMKDMSISRTGAQLVEMGEGVEVKDWLREMQMIKFELFQKKLHLKITQLRRITDALENK